MKWFLIPNGFSLPDGQVQIQNIVGDTSLVDLNSLKNYEIPESQAREWAKGQLGEVLGEIRGSIDGKLLEWRERLAEFNRTPVTEDAKVTPNAAPALLSLFKHLPGIMD